jgi:hypothetical protein
MTRDEQFEVIAENVPKVYETGERAGKKAEHDAFWDVFQNKGARADYSRAFQGYGWTFANFYPKYDIRPAGSAPYLFYAHGSEYNSAASKGSLKERLEECGVVLDTSKATSISDMFNYNKVFTEIPTIDVTGTTGSASARVFANTYAELITIEKIITKEDVTYVSWFSSASKLANVAFEGVIGQDIDLHWSPLSKESIQSVINHLSDTATGKTLTLSKAAVEKAFKNIRMEIPIGLTTTQEGANVTATDNGDGTITLNGAVDNDTFFEVGDPTDTFSAGTYTLSLPHNDYGTFYITLYDSDGKFMAGYDEWSNGEEITFTASKDFTMTAQLYVMGPREFNDVVIAKPTIYQDWDSLAATKPNWTISLV